jgi:hypothetical protein
MELLREHCLVNLRLAVVAPAWSVMTEATVFFVSHCVVPDLTEGAVVLTAVKDAPLRGGLRPSLTSAARVGLAVAGRDEGTVLSGSN